MLSEDVHETGSSPHRGSPLSADENRRMLKEEGLLPGSAGHFKPHKVSGS